VFSSRVVWLLLVGRLLTDPVWYFYQFWFPKYLNAERVALTGPVDPSPGSSTPRPAWAASPGAGSPAT
jgi:hypothetical protein